MQSHDMGRARGCKLVMTCVYRHMNYELNVKGALQYFANITARRRAELGSTHPSGEAFAEGLRNMHDNFALASLHKEELLDWSPEDL